MQGIRSERGKAKLRLNAVHNALLMRELMDGACTARDLMAASGMTQHTVQYYVNALHRYGCIHVAAWERDASGKQSIRAFTFGNAPDAKKAPPLSARRQAKATQERHHLRLIAGTPARKAA